MLAACIFAQEQYAWEDATRCGASSWSYDNGYSMDFDSSGNLYISGSVGPNAVFGSIQCSNASLSTFIAKRSTDGEFQWVAYTGGAGATSIAVDSSGDSYIIGNFSTTVTFGNVTLTSTGSTDIFIAKCSSSGVWLWAKKVGGSSDDEGRGIVVDSNGYVYVTGYVYGSTDIGTSHLMSYGFRDTFVAKLSPTGDWMSAINVGGGGNDYPYSLDIDSSNNLIVAGFHGSDEAIFGSHVLNYPSGVWVAYIAKFDNSLNCLWANGAYSNSGSVKCYSVATDLDNNVIVTGGFEGTSYMGDYSLTSLGGYDSFIGKLSSSGGWIWAFCAGGSNDQFGFCVDTDANGNAFVAGSFSVGISFGSLQLISEGVHNIFIAKVSSSGNIICIQRTSGSGDASPSFIKVRDELTVYITATSQSGSGAPIFGGISNLSVGNRGIIIAQLSKFYVDFSSSSTSIELGSPINFNDTSNGHPTAWAWDFNNDGITDSSQQNPSKTYDAVGTYSVNLRATVDANTSSTTTKVNYINVIHTNHVPTITSPIIPITFNEDTTYNLLNLSNHFTDSDLTYGDHITYSYTPGSNMSIDISNGIVTITPEVNYNGTQIVTFTATDDLLASVSIPVTITVAPVNDPPVINLPLSLNFNEDSSLTLDLNSYVSDIDNAILTMSAQNGAHIFVTITGMSATMTASPHWNGTEIVHFTVSDGQSSIAGQTTVTVDPVNDSPVIDMPASFTFSEDSNLLINMASYVSDVDNSNITLTANGNQNVTVLINGLSATLGALPNWYGSESITFTVNDNVGRAIASDITNVIVTPVNDPPVINLPVSFTFAEDGNLEVNFASYVSDIDNANLIVTAQNSEHISVAMNGLTATLAAAANWNGTEAIHFTVSDGLLTATGQTNVIVTPLNDAPTINLPTSFIFNEDSALNINLLNYASDIDNADLTLTATGNQNVTINVNGINVILGALPNWSGSEILVFTVNDNATKAVAIDTVLVTVIPVNDPPVIDSFFPIQTTLTVQLNDTMSFGINATDVDSQVYYSWFINNELQSNSTNEFTHLFDQSATYHIKGIATDGVFTVEKIWTLTVPVGNDDPIVTPLTTRLYQNYPNPFNPETSIRYSLKNSGYVNVSIFNIRGELIKILQNCNLNAGDYTQTWNGLNDHNLPVSSGIYYIRMTTSSDVYVVKTILMK
jgi:PKD repeat protein